MIAKELNIDAIIEGTVVEAGGVARITAKLIRVRQERSCGRRVSSVISATCSPCRATWLAASPASRSHADNQEKARSGNTSRWIRPCSGKSFWPGTTLPRAEEGLRKAVDFFKAAIAGSSQQRRRACRPCRGLHRAGWLLHRSASGHA